MSSPLDNMQASRTSPDLRDLARRAVAAAAAIAGISGILAGRPLLTVIERAGIVCVGGILAVAVAEAIVRRARRRTLR